MLPPRPSPSLPAPTWWSLCHDPTCRPSVRVRERLIRAATDLARMRGAAPRLFPLLVSTSRHGQADVADLGAVLAETPARPFLVDAGFLAHDPAAVRRLQAGEEPAGRLARTALMRTARTVADQIERIAEVPATRDCRFRIGGGIMTDLDYALIKRLQGELGRLRQDEILRRRGANLPALTGPDAVQHGKALVQKVVGDYESNLVESGSEPVTWEARQDLVEALEARLFGAGSLQRCWMTRTSRTSTSTASARLRGVRRRHDGEGAADRGLGRGAGRDDPDARRPRGTLGAGVRRRQRPGQPAAAGRLPAVRGPVGDRSSRSSRSDATAIARVTLKDLIGLETIDEELAEFLAALVRARKNVMVAGATSAGKTTLLRALAAEIGPEERILTVERSLELGLDEDLEQHPNAIAFEERLPNAEGAGAVTMAELVRDTLRMNPSRVIVGEVLGDEVVTMLNAMTQGNDGSLSTIHANSSADVVHKIATYAIQAPERLPWEATVRLVADGPGLHRVHPPGAR